MLRFLKKLFFDDKFQKKKQFLKTLALFGDLKDGELAALCRALHSRTYHAGETIFVEGDIGRAVFILESGKVDLFKSDDSGKPVRTFQIDPGEFFGEMALLEQLPRTASAVAAERSHLHLLYRSKIESLLQHQPRIGVVIMTRLAQLLSARLRRATAASPDAAAVAPNA